MSDKESQNEGSSKLLVVEDFYDNRVIFSRLLTMCGFQVTDAANGSEAIEALRQELPDLIITDLIMPEVNGLELIYKLKQNKQTSLIPIIAVTAGEKELLNDALKFGAEVVFQKPIDFDEVLASIERLLESSPPSDPNAALKPDESLIVPIQRTIITVNEHLTSIFRHDPEALRSIDPFKFESVVAELFQEEGYEVMVTPARADGGKDIYVYKNDPLTETMFLVECKRYVPPNKVDVSVVRQLFGVVQQERASGGIIVTTSYFTKSAKDFAASVPYQLFLRDFDYLTRWLKKEE
jgi:CheY-like chemotaxis protein